MEGGQFGRYVGLCLDKKLSTLDRTDVQKLVNYKSVSIGIDGLQSRTRASASVSLSRPMSMVDQRPRRRAWSVTKLIGAAPDAITGHGCRSRIQGCGKRC